MRSLKINDNFKNLFFKALLVSFFLVLIAFAFIRIPKFINKVVNKTTKISEYNLLAQNFLGLNGKKDILILFMNNAEQRYGGGFIGSVGYVTVDSGKIKTDPVREVYYYDHDFEKVNYVEKSTDPNEGNVLYNLRDSGQSLDWPSNAKRAKNVFERESGKNVDMVVGVTPEILKYLIRETGTVKLDDYQVTITEGNIIDTIQKEVEYGSDKKAGKDPKTILTSLVSVLVERLSQKSIVDLNKLALGLKDLSDSKQIIIYSPNYELAKVLEKYNLDGSMHRTASDYLLISEKNISVDKSNGYIDRKLYRTINISEDGTAEVTSKIVRNQTIPMSFPYVDPNVPDVLTYLIKNNKSQIKIAIPSRSEIISSPENISLLYRGKEGGYDIYGFDSFLEPLTPSEYQMKYKLPFKLAGDKNIQFDSYLQYPNGGWPYQLSSEIITPPGWKLISSNKQVNISDNKVYYNEIVNKDILMSFTYEKK